MLESPGWVLAALLAVLAHHWLGLSVGVAVLLVALWVIKDFALYPWLRTAFEGDAPSESDKLVGSSGVVQVALDPVGLVRLGHELWRAEAAPADRPIVRGRPVRVEAVHGLTLRVVPAPVPKPPAR
jgi:membrane protein implicated in regulation of membrane protease activity